MANLWDCFETGIEPHKIYEGNEETGESIKAAGKWL